MEVKFIKTSPTQNMTILVESRLVRNMYPKVASRLMAYDHVFAEQVGFIESAENVKAWARLQMMAGEFCGNATMALAAVMAWRRRLQYGERLEVPLEVSGTNELLVCGIEATSNGYLCRLKMPLPLAIDKTTVLLEGERTPVTIIKYPGIVHVIVNVREFDRSAKEKAQDMARLVMLLQGEAALGVMLYREESSELEPLVYVPGTNTMIWERGCGSGVAAIGAYAALEAGRDIHLEIKQPGGVVQVWAQCLHGKLADLTIQGHVHISAEGTAFI
ncbi:diaminopimelate epimerase [Paenibacillus sp. PL91]|uniref:diaminopimelate epimerase n=1 Tax=Paenibacillus sp. PL91 TaxID=2729538 RepID=UPI00145CDEFE|nr:diaminopimelate epimerase [Paenibacillus sp. PL91]MBC9204030.1 diaminopimelate epimerase [Paenibacillus sp. PL91]